MTLISTALTLLILSQAPVDPVIDHRVQAIAPFVGNDVFAILEVDFGRADLPGLAARVAGDSPAGLFAGLKNQLQWCQLLRKAGAREVYFVFSVADMSGPPLVIIPHVDGADEAQIGRLIQGNGKAPHLSGLNGYARLHGASVAGSNAAIDRVRMAMPGPRPELSAALAVLGGDGFAARLLVLPSADSRRVLEEMVPNFPAELGSGPMTDLTRGLLWAACGLEAGPRPSLRLVVESKDATAARGLERLAQNAIDYVGRSPDLQQLVPELRKIIAVAKPNTDGSRLTITVDAKQAASLVDSITLPARQAAIRSQCVNNEKQIGLAIHNYIAAHGSFPPAFTVDKAGKPLLSWRVLLLPYIEQDALFKEFHLDEPWDSPNNKALIARMPSTYRCPGESEDLARDGKTRYVTPRGQATIFPGTEVIKLNDVTDGTSNTIMVVEAGDANAVVWTKPDDWTVDPEPNTAGVFTSHAGSRGNGANFGFADGSVRFLHETVVPRQFRSLLTRNGTEVISPDDF